MLLSDGKYSSANNSFLIITAASFVYVPITVNILIEETKTIYLQLGRLEEKKTIFTVKIILGLVAWMICVMFLLFMVFWVGEI